jgi:hypothetical protein
VSDAAEWRSRVILQRLHCNEWLHRFYVLKAAETQREISRARRELQALQEGVKARAEYGDGVLS